MYSVKIFIKILFAILCSRFIRNSELACEIFFPYDFLPSGAMQPICNSTRWKKKFKKVCSLLHLLYTITTEKTFETLTFEKLLQLLPSGAVCCVLQWDAVCCSVLQRVAEIVAVAALRRRAIHLQHACAELHVPCITLQHPATRCNTLQHTAAHCSTLQHTAAHCSTLQRTAALCNTPQHSATPCNTL